MHRAIPADAACPRQAPRGRDLDSSRGRDLDSSRGKLLVLSPEGIVVDIEEDAARLLNRERHGTLNRALVELFPQTERLAVTNFIATVNQDEHAIIQLPGRTSQASDEAPIHEFEGRRINLSPTPHLIVFVRNIAQQPDDDDQLPRQQPEPSQDLATLLDVSRLLTSILELPPLLDLILAQLNRVADFTGASIWLLDEDGLVLVADRAPEGHATEEGLRIPRERVSWVDAVPEAVIVADVQDDRDDSPGARSYRAAVGSRFSYSHSWMRIPLIYQEKTIGMISLSHREPGHFTPNHATLALAIANQAAIAITNARLLEQAQEIAALEERQRLARELHDSVTQALFSTTLHARAAQLAFEQAGLDPAGSLGRSIAEVRTLTQGALAEMRALIFELRPGALAEEGLVHALRKQAAALSAREGIDIQIVAPDARLPLPPRTEEHLYRIALETLHNVLKHAAAQSVAVRFEQRTEGLLVLEIADDGVGFDATRAHPGHIGLKSMAERASAIGATLEIESARGQGATVRVWLPAVPPNAVAERED